MTPTAASGAPLAPGDSPAAIFTARAALTPDAAFLAFRPAPDAPFEDRTYAAVAARVAALRTAYAAAGWGAGARAALLIGSRPDFLAHFLALNGLGVSVVPLNVDGRAEELGWQVAHCGAGLVVAAPDRMDLAHALAGAVPVVDAGGDLADLPAAPRPAEPGQGAALDEAAILYTSGTTGRPKGCVLQNRYFALSGQAYAGWGGRLALGRGERLLNPLPLHHMNALAITTTALMLTGGCAVLTERFSPSAWWADCADSRADLIHYLGVMPALLLARPPAPEDRAHAIRAAVGAGVDPEHHAAFEARFGFPLLELWGMTETGRCFIDAEEPRAVGTRAFGRPGFPLLGRVMDDAGTEAPRGTEGEFQVRAAGPDPRAGFFARYLDNPAATAEVWTDDDWFRTGDVVRQAPDGNFHFVERRKNIIRRSGENIAAAEVEACLQTHPAVAQAAVLAHPDKLREEEVFACVVLRPGAAPDAALARALFDWCHDRLSYFKAPGWLAFRDALPVTGTQKVQKGAIFAPHENPEALAHDFRDAKRRARKEPAR